jgi:hypothetical protein
MSTNGSHLRKYGKKCGFPFPFGCGRLVLAETSDKEVRGMIYHERKLLQSVSRGLPIEGITVH